MYYIFSSLLLPLDDFIASAGAPSPMEPSIPRPLPGSAAYLPPFLLWIDSGMHHSTNCFELN